VAGVDRKTVCLMVVLAGASQAQNAGPVGLSLRQAIDVALKQSPQIQITKLRALQAESSVKAVRSGLFPQLSVGASSGYENLNLKALGFMAPGLPENTGPLRQFDLRPSLNQTIYDPGLRKALLASRERAEESRWNSVSMQESILLAVTGFYLEALDYGARIEAGSARLGSAEAWLEQVRHFVEAGTASRLDQSRAGIQVDNERRALVEFRSGLAIKKLLLANLLGLPADTELELTESFAPPLPGAVPLDVTLSKALEGRPEMRAAQARLRAAIADKQKAQSGRYPVVGVTTDFGRMGNAVWSNLFTYTVRGTVRLPILQGGRVEAEVSSSDAVVRQINEEIRGIKLQIESDVHTALIERNAAEEAYEWAADATTLAQKSLELATDRFEAGLASNIEVVNAQEVLASAQSAAIRCVFDYHIARARLAKAQGNIRDLFE